MKCLWIGGSGLQYRRSFPCPVLPDDATRIVTRFFADQGAVPEAAIDGKSMTFTRGREWVSSFSWLLPLSATWPRQTIEVSIRQEHRTAMVEVSYDITMIYMMVVAPNALAREARELQRLLQPK